MKLDLLMNVSSVQLTTETKSVEMYTKSPVLLNISLNISGNKILNGRSGHSEPNVDIQKQFCVVRHKSYCR